MADTHKLINQGTPEEIYELQKFLIAYNFTDDSGSAVKPSLQFDKPTVEALKKFQEQQGLTVDGKAGPNTVTAMVKYGEETDIPAKEEPQSEPVAPAISTASLGDADAALSSTPKAEPIKTAPKLGDKPQQQQTTDPAAAKRMAAIKALQAKRAAQQSAQSRVVKPDQHGEEQAGGVGPKKTTPKPAATPAAFNHGMTPTARPVQTTPTPQEQPAVDTEMRPKDSGAEKNTEEIPKEPQDSTVPAGTSSKQEEVPPPPPPNPNQMAVDKTSKALDTWYKAFEPLKQRDDMPLKTVGSLIKNLQDIWANGQVAIKSDKKLLAKWQTYLNDLKTYHNSDRKNNKVNEAHLLADEMLYEGLFDKFTDLFKPTKSEPGQATDRRSRQKRKDNTAATNKLRADARQGKGRGSRGELSTRTDVQHQEQQDEITDRVVTLVSDKIKSLGYDPNDMPGNPELKKAYQDIGKTIESIQAIVKQYQQKGAHADLVNIKEQFGTLQSQLKTYAKG